MKTCELLLGQLDVALGGLAVEHRHCGLVREAPGAPGGPHPLQRLGRGEGLHHQHLQEIQVITVILDIIYLFKIYDSTLCQQEQRNCRPTKQCLANM